MAESETATGQGRSLVFLLFLVLVVGGGLAIGFATAPGAWYAGLAKPSFNPPNWVFGPVWTVLYFLIAIAGARVWLADRRSPAMTLWGIALLLNFVWSPVFFGAHLILPALVIILLLLGAIAGFIGASRSVDRIASWLFVPYALWVAFAALLNGSILALN